MTFILEITIHPCYKCKGIYRKDLQSQPSKHKKHINIMLQ